MVWAREGVVWWGGREGGGVPARGGDEILQEGGVLIRFPQFQPWFHPVVFEVVARGCPTRTMRWGSQDCLVFFFHQLQAILADRQQLSGFQALGGGLFTWAPHTAQLPRDASPGRIQVVAGCLLQVTQLSGFLKIQLIF